MSTQSDSTLYDSLHIFSRCVLFCFFLLPLAVDAQLASVMDCPPIPIAVTERSAADDYYYHDMKR